LCERDVCERLLCLVAQHVILLAAPVLDLLASALKLVLGIALTLFEFRLHDLAHLEEPKLESVVIVRHRLTLRPELIDERFALARKVLELPTTLPLVNSDQCVNAREVKACESRLLLLALVELEVEALDRRIL
jgi:hypothetical protein